MWMGSKVPPRIPVRTGSRIGARRCHQAEGPGDIGSHTVEPRQRIHVSVGESGGEMNSRPAVGTARPGDELSPLHPLTPEDCYLGEIGHRDLEAGNRLDGHRLHPRYGTGKGDRPGRRGTDRLTYLGCEIDAPVARVLPHRGVTGHDRAVHRGHETHRCDSDNCEHTPLSSPRMYLPRIRVNRGARTIRLVPEYPPKWDP